MKYPDQVVKGIEAMKALDFGTKCNSVWGAVWEDGTMMECSHTACFGASAEAKYKGCEWIVSRIQHNGAASDDTYRTDMVKYFDWLFNVSPWKDVFITKSGEQAVSSRWLVTTCRVPANVLISALQATRIPTEYSNPMFVLNDLSELGVNPNLAFLLGMCMSGGDLRKGGAKFTQNSSNHRCLNTDMLNATTMNNFILGVHAKANPIFKDSVGYTSPYYVRDVWGSGDDQLLPYLAKHFDVDKVLGAGLEVAACLNPFKKKEVVQKGMNSYEDNIKAMAIFSKEIVKGFDLHA